MARLRMSFGSARCLCRRAFPTPRLSPGQVTDILAANEFSKDLYCESVKSFESNLLPSNIPPEDRHVESRCRYTTGLLFGVFDGHGGNNCVEVVTKRLMHYVATSLLCKDALDECIRKIDQVNSVEELNLLEVYTSYVMDNTDKHLENLYKKSFHAYLKELRTKFSNVSTQDAFEKAFLRLDDDLSREAANQMIPMAVALSGCVGCVAHIDGTHLHVGNVGDCQAVLGQETDANHWVAKKLTNEHNHENAKEMHRLFHEHPASESHTIIHDGRLLGQLSPLRAFGDFRYKWNVNLQNKLFVPMCSPSIIPPHYHTPPYLSAQPEVTYHRLTAKDKFLILGTDGFWEFLTPAEVVALIGEHMCGRTALNPLVLPQKTLTLKQVEQLLVQRQEALQKKPIDANAATHLIRHALSSTDYGLDNARVSQLLSFPEDLVRAFRDDITITIVFFDSSYISKCPSEI